MTVKTINLRLGGIGEGIGGGIGALTTTPFTIVDGDTVRFVGTVQHMGPAYSGYIYYAIGSKGVTFDELWPGYQAISIPASVTAISYTLPIVNITVTSKSAGLYEAYGKIAVNLTPTTTPDMIEYGALDQITYVGTTHLFSNLNVTYSKA